MSSPVDPILRTTSTRRGERRRSDRRDMPAVPTEDRMVPVVIDGPIHASEKAEPKPALDSGATFRAQLMGQSGQKRGLRGGPLVIDAAQGAYKSVEYSGPAERRAKLGQITKTEV